MKPLKVFDNLIINTYPLYFVQNADARNFIAAVVGIKEEIPVKIE